MPVGAQSQNFALSLSSSSSNPPPQQRRHLAGATGPYGPFTGYAAVLGRSRFLGPAQKLLEEICDVGGRPSQLDRCSDDGLLDLDAMDAVADVGHEMDSSDHAAADGGTVSGAEQQWRKTRLISLMEEFQMLDREVQRLPLMEDATRVVEEHNGIPRLIGALSVFDMSRSELQASVNL
ncbi:hypothetical protein ZWY2020_059224 [Hordeum vulgare]|nr:hypothetical protein ZWY2020_059224 [Hordeum vulgare]